MFYENIIQLFNEWVGNRINIINLINVKVKNIRPMYNNLEE